MTIYEMLKVKITSGVWPEGFSRQRGGHWLRRFSLKARMDSGQMSFADFFEFCFQKNISFFT
jgi:hypothetical protein